MKTSDFYYELPQELIAQDPLVDRSSSRLLVMDKKTGVIEHKIFKDVKKYLKEETALFLMIRRLSPPGSSGPKKTQERRSKCFC